MLQIKLLIAFDGTAFHGWQVQPGQRTVQEVLGDAISEMTHTPVRPVASSRTDAGVHALAMPVVFRTGSRIPPHGWLRGLNSLLPSDLSVHHVEEVPSAFHVRRSAFGKTYRYRIWNASYPSALEARYSWLVHPPLEIEAMREGAVHLLGEHDFSAFRAAHCDSVSVRRYMESVVIEKWSELVEIEVSANAFLRNMARIIAGTLVEVGLGRRPADDVARVLATGERPLAGVTAPAQGLFLKEVRYT